MEGFQALCLQHGGSVLNGFFRRRPSSSNTKAGAALANFVPGLRRAQEWNAPPKAAWRVRRCRRTGRKAAPARRGQLTPHSYRLLQTGNDVLEYAASRPHVVTLAHGLHVESNWDAYPAYGSNSASVSPWHPLPTNMMSWQPLPCLRMWPLTRYCACLPGQRCLTGCATALSRHSARSTGFPSRRAIAMYIASISVIGRLSGSRYSASSSCT